jgi:hypothetical protein
MIASSFNTRNRLMVRFVVLLVESVTELRMRGNKKSSKFGFTKVPSEKDKTVFCRKIIVAMW